MLQTLEKPWKKVDSTSDAAKMDSRTYSQALLHGSSGASERYTFIWASTRHLLCSVFVGLDEDERRKGDANRASLFSRGNEGRARERQI